MKNAKFSKTYVFGQRTRRLHLFGEFYHSTNVSKLYFDHFTFISFFWHPFSVSRMRMSNCRNKFRAWSVPNRLKIHGWIFARKFQKKLKYSNNAIFLHSLKQREMNMFWATRFQWSFVPRDRYKMKGLERATDFHSSSRTLIARSVSKKTEKFTNEAWKELINYIQCWEKETSEL